MTPDSLAVRVVSIDGAVVRPEQAVISVHDRGFLYGDSVFEVTRVYDGVPFALDEHLARLERSAERVLIRVPVSRAVLASEVHAAIRASCLCRRSEAATGAGDRYVRVMLTRGSGGTYGYDVAGAGEPSRVILVEPLRAPPIEQYRDGIRLITKVVARPIDGLVPGAKYANYLAALLAASEVKRAGASEVLVVNVKGHVIEGSTSNLFIMKSGKLLTPPESDGILAGITRANILSIAEELRIPVEQPHLVAEDVYAADEAFITSSIREVLSVIGVDDRAIGAGRPGQTTRALHARLRARILGPAPRMPWE